MKSLLLAGGVLLLLLGIVLCIAAIVVFLIARNRRAPAPAVAVAPPPPPPPPIDEDSTLVTGHGFGALHAVSGPLKGQTFAVNINGFTIGRDRAQAEVVVEDPSVSKRHVWVGVKDGAVTAIDQSSTNGTYLNSVSTRIGQVRLTPGDTLILSDDVTRFVYKA